MKSHTLLLLFGFWIGFINLQARTTTNAYLINSVNGLSNNYINDIYQDSNGFIWFGTHDGLNRFDGYEYVVFRHDIYDSTSIASGLIHDITEDYHGNIWVATNKGISKYNTTTNSFTNFIFHLPDFGRMKNETFSLVFSDPETLWCLQSDNLLSFNTADQTFHVYSFVSEGSEVLGYRRNSLYYDRQNRLLFIGTLSGLKYLELNSGKVKTAMHGNSVIFDMLLDQNGTALLGTGEGLYRCTITAGTEVPVDGQLVYQGSQVRGMAQLTGNRLVLASRTGTVLFDLGSNSVISEPFILLEGQKELPEVRDVLMDNAFNLWVGTFGGVCHADLKPLRFSYYNTSSEGITLDNNMISSIQSDDNKLYLGSWSGGFQVIDLSTRKKLFFSNSDKRNFYPERTVNLVRKDRKGRLWVFSEGAYLYDHEKQNFTHISKVLDIPGLEEITGSRIYDMEEPDKNIKVISHSNGFYYIDELKGTFRNITSIKTGEIILQLSGVTSIEIKGDHLWLGLTAGVVEYSLTGGAHEFYPTESGNGLNERVQTLKIDSRGRLWVGTPAGLFRFVEEDSTFYGYSVQVGLANDYIYSIEEDKSGKLWLGTNKGIVNLDPDNFNVLNYGIQHGLSNMEFNLNATAVSGDGVMYFGGINGVNFFHPDSLIQITSSINTVITGIRYFSRDNKSYQPFVPEQLTIRDHESVQIFFSRLDYSDPEYKSFRYRLSDSKGVGKWRNIGKGNSIILSGMNHGTYTFEVLGSNIDGQWGEYPASFDLKVIAPVYRRKIFIGIIFLPIMLLVYFVFEYRTKTLRKSNKALREKEIAAREVLKQKNLLSRRNKSIEDSLKYAQRIQNAMFTSESEIRKMFPNSFILQKPKDIVSGDFYWAKKFGTKVFLAAVDCTGHGVPGAFMSLIGLEFFRQIIGNQGVDKPSDILNEINRNFDLVFDNMDDLEMRDGMDLSFCVIDTETNILEFSGAFNSLYIIRNSEILEIKGDKSVLGPDLGYGRTTFTNHQFELQEDDIIYMFSDGYADQFGGPEGKKFKYRRFRHLLLSIFEKPMLVQRQILENSFNEWTGAEEQVDDILVIGVRPYSNSIGSGSFQK
ncbi:MAG: two-component regulator propeller domain-containing protein [Bacteroidales bacterium]